MASGKAGREIRPLMIFLMLTGSTRARHSEKWQGGSQKNPHHRSIRSDPEVELKHNAIYIGKGLISLGKKSTGIIHAQLPPPLILWDDHFLHSHIYLESDNSLPLVSCWSLSSIVQDVHYSTGNQQEVQ